MLNVESLRLGTHIISFFVHGDPVIPVLSLNRSHIFAIGRDDRGVVTISSPVTEVTCVLSDEAYLDLVKWFTNESKSKVKSLNS